eukprot:15413071-Alexandrium_andersonii.AAC.1
MSLRLTIWKEYLKTEEWRSLRDRPVAVALQHLPKDKVHGIEEGWGDVIVKGAVVGMTGYAQVAAADVPDFERKSGRSGVFVRCIARHRPSEAAARQP